MKFVKFFFLFICFILFLMAVNSLYVSMNGGAAGIQGYDNAIFEFRISYLGFVVSAVMAYICKEKKGSTKSDSSFPFLKTFSVISALLLVLAVAVTANEALKFKKSSENVINKTEKVSDKISEMNGS